MTNGTPWTPEHTATLERMAGRVPAADIGRLTGHTERTIRQHMKDAGMDPYAPRPKWTRRDYLLAGAAGLMENRA